LSAKERAALGETPDEKIDLLFDRGKNEVRDRQRAF